MAQALKDRICILTLVEVGVAGVVGSDCVVSLYLLVEKKVTDLSEAV